MSMNHDYCTFNPTIRSAPLRIEAPAASGVSILAPGGGTRLSGKAHIYFVCRFRSRCAPDGACGDLLTCIAYAPFYAVQNSHSERSTFSGGGELVHSRDLVLTSSFRTRVRKHTTLTMCTLSSVLKADVVYCCR